MLQLQLGADLAIVGLLHHNIEPGSDPLGWSVNQCAGYRGRIVSVSYNIGPAAEDCSVQSRADDQGRCPAKPDVASADL